MNPSRMLALGVLLPLVAAAQNRSDELVETLVDALPGDTTTNVETLRTNGFELESSQVKEVGADFAPTGREFRLLRVTGEGVFKVAVERGREAPGSGGVAAFHGRSGAPMLSAGDRNGDGRFDVLTYAVLDEDGEHVLDVTDYEADGQLDLRVNFKESYSEIWHVDRWYRTEIRDGTRGIVVEGRFVELEMKDGRWMVRSR